MEGSAHAVTGSRAAVHLLRREHRFLSEAFRDIRDPIAVCDARGRIILVNHAMVAFAGLQENGYLPEAHSAYGNLFDLDGIPIAAEEAPLARTLRGEVVAGVDLVAEATSGRRRQLIADGRRLSDATGGVMGAIVVYRDVTDEREAEARLAFQTTHNPITGLPNRALFIERVKPAVERTQHSRGWTAVLSINIDHFAEIATRLGDRSGDHSGDQLLEEVAHRLEVLLRPPDGEVRSPDTLAHPGGDQFLMLCEDVTDTGAAERVANRVDAALGALMPMAGENLSLTAAIGITLTRDPMRDPESLVREAEAAMRSAKQRGVGRQELFTGAIQAQRVLRIDSEAALRLGLARGEFELAYQPKVSLLTDRPTGVEALLRWNRPGIGVVAPLDFIPLAEESGLIVPIGEWVLGQACRDAQRWSRALPGGRPLVVAVNVSPRQFEPGLAETIGNIIARASIDPQTICIEVTESMVMRNADVAITALRELKSLGVMISIDDFGTGFSSLSYLSRFPLDELKVDRSFIERLGKDPEATAIVAAVIGMAHALNLRVVAEGVETADHVARLRTLGCDEAQGYFFARPAPAADVDALNKTAVSVARHHEPRGGGINGNRAERVLVVDDAADVRMLARASLSAVGFEVEEVGSGEEAIVRARHFKPDCLVLDVNLPGMSGFDVCRVLRDDPANARTTILILTGDSDPDEKVQAFSLKADDYMVKPFSPRDLVSRVTLAMRRRAEMFAKTPE